MLDEPTIDPIPLHPSLPALRACLARAASPSAIRAAFRDLLDADQDETDPHEGALLDRLDWTDLNPALLPRGIDGSQQVEEVIAASNSVAVAPKADDTAADDTVAEDTVALAIAEGLRLSQAIRGAGSDSLHRGEAADWLLASDFEEAVERLGNCAGAPGFTSKSDPAAALVHRRLVPRLADLRAVAEAYEAGGGSADAHGDSGAAVTAHDAPSADRLAAATGHRFDRRRAPAVSTTAQQSDASKSDKRGDAPRPLCLQILSDLHLDVWDYRPVIADGVDAIVVAGDVREDAVRAVRWLDDAFGAAGVPVVYVLGNHEPYGQVYHAMLEAARAAAAGTCVRLLENDATVLDIRGAMLRVLGATVWTDLAVDGSAARARALRFGSHMMNDYRYIRTRADDGDSQKEGRAGSEAREGNASGDAPGQNALAVDALDNDASSDASGDAPVRRLVPADTVRWHEASRAWLTARLGEQHVGPTLVVTHHAPHPASLDPRFAGDGTDCFFASDLSALIERHGPDVWVHGHVHQRRDYIVGCTRIVCNPRGYPGERSGFDPGLVIEVPSGSDWNDGSESASGLRNASGRGDTLDCDVPTIGEDPSSSDDRSDRGEAS